MKDPIIISVDLETVSINPDTAAMIQVAAVAHNRTTGEEIGHINHIIDYNDALKYGRPDQETLNWWGRQPETVRAVLETSRNGGHSMSNAMLFTASWIATLNLKNEAGKYQNHISIVARAPSFDLAILHRHLDMLQMTAPWAYWQERDHRSLEDALRTVGNMIGCEIPAYLDAFLPAHNALSDARNQGLYLCQAYQTLSQHARS